MPERHTRIVGNQRYVWFTTRLWQLAESLEPFEVAIDSIPEVDTNCWFESREATLREVAGHVSRIQNADLTYPIILNQDGELMDGGHRICKALVNGQSSILAVRFDPTPEPDERIPLETT